MASHMNVHLMCLSYMYELGLAVAHDLPKYNRVQTLDDIRSERLLPRLQSITKPTLRI